MTELEGCIKYHESLLRQARVYMEPGTLAAEEATVKFLKELKRRIDHE